ncbi:MAG: class I SAM-dependent methyltransferase [Mongoliitalea sp.]
MKKFSFKNSFFHVQYWFIKESARALKIGIPYARIIKYYPAYMKSNLGYSKGPIQLGIPLITFEAIEYLKKLVHPKMKVFEYGSGGSTRFFAERVLEVHSVEHNEEWYRIVKEALVSKENLNLYLKTGCNVTKDSFDIISDEPEDGLDYREYTKVISNFADNYFDLVFVDGKARNACIQHALPKLKSNGILIVDNSNRRKLADSLDLIKNSMVLRSFDPSVGSKIFTQTSFYKKI